MKFHLPKQLFAAILAATVQVYAETTTPTPQWDDATATLQGDYTQITQTGSGYRPGYVGGYIALSNADATGANDSRNKEFNKNNVTIDVTGTEAEKTNITFLIGIGPDGYSAVGNKTINIGGQPEHVYVQYVAGGVHYNMRGTLTANYKNGRGQQVADDVWVALQSTKDKQIQINVTGGTVGQIMGGNNNGSTVIPAAITALQAKKSESDLMTYLAGETAWDTQEAIVINVSGGKVGYASDGETKLADAAILGAGGKGFSVNNKVQINISGEADINGDIYAGAQTSSSVAGPLGKEIQTHINSSEINISGGTISGNVFGGGSCEKSLTTQSRVKYGTAINLSGGSIINSGCVYGAGDHDTVDGGTAVTIIGEGTKVDGYIYGGGIESEVTGDRVLTVDESYTGDKEYKVADFTDIAVNADVTLASMSAASEGTDVKIADEATLKLTGEKTTHTATNVTGGTLYVDATTFELAEGGTLESKVVLDNHATLDLNGVEAACDIVVYGCTIAGAGNFTGNLNVDGGQLTLADPTCAQNVTITNGGSITGASLATTTLTVAPTDSTTPVITSDLTIHENGTITMEGGEKLVVTGSVTLGANSRIIATGDYEKGDEILTATGGLNYEDGVTLNLGGVIVEVQGNTLVVMSIFDQPLADALSANNWALAMSSRAFVNAVRGQRTNTGCIANGRGTAWAAVLGGTQDLAGADIDLKGAAVGADMKVGEKSSVGIALGYIDGETQSPGWSGKVEQEGAYVALYGEHGLKKLSSTSCLSLDWVAAYGSTESELDGADWTQDSLQLNTRLSWNKKVTDRLCMSVFGGLEYYTNESDTVEGVKTGSVQNLRGEIGVGARYVAWGTPAVTDNKTGAMISAGCQKLVLHGELRYMNDMVRSNPVIEMDGLRGGSDNPGRQGVGIEAGATYRIGERWSASANYGYNTMDDSREHRVNVGASYTF